MAALGTELMVTEWHCALQATQLRVIALVANPMAPVAAEPAIALGERRSCAVDRRLHITKSQRAANLAFDHAVRTVWSTADPKPSRNSTHASTYRLGTPTATVAEMPEVLEGCLSGTHCYSGSDEPTASE
jgi:hypothetical protein